MNWTEGQIDGVCVRPLKRYTDARGWLMELYRADETPAAEMPVMGYVSLTHPGVTRGPHEHKDQTDNFAFFGPGNLRVRLWDRREGSPTRGRMTTIEAGEDNPISLTVPPGVVHAYRNTSDRDAWVLNFSNRLYRGAGRREPPDEIRYEDGEDAKLYSML